eukprot:TRINITY_DN52294_c0_g1_i1.p1 TRINITY_DN52294_c0_g1~~TRINITY_DN52294_c0_g1_i1.p1  ORF type:complete len:103 (+),score=16.41 TRINITY_DN52294_c0_g1_i1:95-403(+)
MCIRDRYQRRVRGALRVDDEHIVSSVNSRNTSYRSLPERPTGQINRTAADLRKLPEQKKATFRCQYGAIRGLSLIHISEPTRLLSISYAVFCLKKKKSIIKK